MNDQETTAIMLQQIQEIEAKDDAQIVGELTGLPIDDLYYKVKTRKGEGLKLSWAGTKQAAQDRGNISLSQPDITETEGHWRIVFRATDLNRNITLYGGCHQPKKMKLEGGGYQDDPYAFQKAISKAQRNAINALLPMTWIERQLKLYARNKMPAQKPVVNGNVAKPAPAMVAQANKDINNLW